MPDLRMLMSGLIFGESPRWHDNRLWCIDVGAQEVIAVDLEGRSEVLVDVPNAYIGNLGFHAWRREEFPGCA